MAESIFSSGTGDDPEAQELQILPTNQAPDSARGNANAAGGTRNRGCLIRTGLPATGMPVPGARIALRPLRMASKSWPACVAARCVHVVCWHSKEGCGSFDCTHRPAKARQEPAARVADYGRQGGPGKALPRRVPMPSNYVPGSSASQGPQQPRRWSWLSIVAAVVTLIGVLAGALTGLLAVLMPGSTVVAIAQVSGVVLGLIAVLLGCIALGAIHHSSRRGTGLAVMSIVVGFIGILGWIGFLGCYYGGVGVGHIAINEFEPDADALNHLAPAVARSVRANVLVETTAGGLFGGVCIGSGVILQIENGSALIVTNRHVVDSKFEGQDTSKGKGSLPTGKIEVKLIGQPARPGTVVWIAPDGIDLALISVVVENKEALAAAWKPKTELLIGNEVFAIGNPQHLNWTLTSGKISQLRLQRCGQRQVHVIRDLRRAEFRQ